MGITMHATDSVEYEPGVYRAKIQKIDEQESRFLDERTGEKKWEYVWTFELLKEGYEDRTLRGWTSTNFGPRAKARQWVEGVLGRPIRAGENISGDELIGKECKLMVSLESGDRGTFAKIVSVNPTRAMKARGQIEVKVDEALDVKVDEALEEDVKDLPF